MPTPTVEDYLERIYSLIKEKGYARVSDIAAALEVHPSTVTRMVQKLDEKDLLDYERYRGLVLTPAGERVGRSVSQRHRALEQLLRILGVEDEAVVQKDTEGIEHHVSAATLGAFIKLVDFFQEDLTALEQFNAFRRRDRNAGLPPERPL